MSQNFVFVIVKKLFVTHLCTNISVRLIGRIIDVVVSKFVWEARHILIFEEEVNALQPFGTVGTYFNSFLETLKPMATTKLSYFNVIKLIIHHRWTYKLSEF